MVFSLYIYIYCCSTSARNSQCRCMRSDELEFDLQEVGKGKNKLKMPVRLGKSGSFGDVFSASHCQNTPVAVKKLKFPASADQLTSSDPARAAFAAFVAEVSFASSLNHPNIVRTLGGVVDPDSQPFCWIVMERLEKSLAEVTLLPSLNWHSCNAFVIPCRSHSITIKSSISTIATSLTS